MNMNIKILWVLFIESSNKIVLYSKNVLKVNIIYLDFFISIIPNFCLPFTYNSRQYT